MTMGTSDVPHEKTFTLERIIENALRDSPFEKRKWFGCPVYLVAGKMFAGIYRNSVFMRLSEPHRIELMSISEEIRPFEPLPGRVMREYLALRDTQCTQAPFFREWIKKAYTYTLSLYPDGQRPAKKRKG